jgi:hypothetical protein
MGQILLELFSSNFSRNIETIHLLETWRSGMKGVMVKLTAQVACRSIETAVRMVSSVGILAEVTFVHGGRAAAELRPASSPTA